MPSSGQRWAAVIVVSSGQDRRIQIQGIQESGVRSQDAAPPPQRQPRPGRGAEEGADHGEEAAGLQGQHHPEGEHTLAQLQRGSCLPSPPSVHFMTAMKARLLTPALSIMCIPVSSPRVTSRRPPRWCGPRWSRGRPRPRPARPRWRRPPTPSRCATGTSATARTGRSPSPRCCHPGGELNNLNHVDILMLNVPHVQLCLPVCGHPALGLLHLGHEPLGDGWRPAQGAHPHLLPRAGAGHHQAGQVSCGWWKLVT